MIEFIKKNYLYLVFGLSLIASLVSLYFSTALQWTPCLLCWYQRIFMFPIVIISLVGIIKKDRSAGCYIMPLAIIGTLVAIFHNLLYWGVIPESFVPCQNGISCKDDNLQLFGIITIPLLSLIAFAVIDFIVVIYKKYENK